MVFGASFCTPSGVQEASRSSVWRCWRAQVLLPGARRLAWSVKTVGWGHGGGLEIPRRWHPSVIPYGGETLVTDGQVDDQLVWWSWHSKLSVWLSVRVSQVVISGLRWSVGWSQKMSSWRSSNQMRSLGSHVGWRCHPWLDGLGWQWRVGWKMMEFTLHHSHVQIRPTPGVLETRHFWTI